jgi:hypothetical protein
MKKSLIPALLLILPLWFTRCSEVKPEQITARKEPSVQYVLNTEYIFNRDSITVAKARATAVQKAESRKYFMTGLDLLANKGEASSSVEYFREAICFYPDEKNYQHLFSAYLKSGNLVLADSTNRIMYQWLDESESALNNALMAAVIRDTSDCMENLEYVIMNGFAFKERITEEKLFDFIKDSPAFQALMISGFGDDEKMRKNLFVAFLKDIPNISIPFEMPVDSTRSFNFDSYINYDYASFIPGMEDTRFARDVTNEYMFVGKFKCEGGYAVIYKSYEMIADTLNPVMVNLITYDSLGKVAGQQLIGCYCSPLESKGFKIYEDLSFDVRTYKSNWRTDPLENGYAGNEVMSREQTEYKTFKITREREVKETEIKAEVVSSQ